MNNNLVNPAVATFVAELVTLPICTVKTNYQNSTNIGVVDTIKKMYKINGIKTFFNASLPAISGQVFSTTSKYFIYRYLEKIGSDKKILNGLISGFISSIMTHPIDVVKIHWQMNDSIVSSIRNNGIKVMYRGYSKTISKICVSSALFFPLYDTFKTKVFTNEKNKYNAVLSSMSSALISTTVMQPLDYAKTRQIYGLPHTHSNPIYYFKGILLNYARIIPHFTIVMTIIDYLEHRKI